MRTALLAVALAACATPPPPAVATELAWLAGTWTSNDGRATTVESWSPTPGGSLLGQGSVGVHTPSGEALLFAESLAIVSDPQGLAYVAWPHGQAPVSFRAVSRSTSQVVFENKEHDFPQRLEYARHGDVLEVTASGVGTDGAPRTDAAKLTLVGPPGVKPPAATPPAAPPPEAPATP